MTSFISETIQNDPSLARDVERASQILKDVIGATSASVAADWKFARDTKGRPLVQLALSDFTGAHAETYFAPDELASEGRVYAKLYRAWGDLLEARSHKQLDVLSGRIQPGE
jgi:hypothetical protein